MWYPSWLGESIHYLCYPNIYLSIVCFFSEIIFFYRFLWYHRNMDHDVFISVHMVVQVEIFYVHAHVSWFDVLDGAFYIDFNCGQVWCWCADLSWVIYHIPSCSESCSMGHCFWVRNNIRGLIISNLSSINTNQRTEGQHMWEWYAISDPKKSDP